MKTYKQLNEPGVIPKTLSQMVWAEEGIGYLPLDVWPQKDYGDEYLKKYLQLDDTPMGRALTAARCAITMKFARQEDRIVDVGACTGAFCEAMLSAGYGGIFGFEVNEAAQRYLRSEGLHTLSQEGARVRTYWDVLEHIPNWSLEFADPKLEYVCLSMPIYTDFQNVVSSKHFRPGEHCWYLTREGLIRKMAMEGFMLVMESDIETRLGREQIGSFVFQKKEVLDGHSN